MKQSSKKLPFLGKLFLWAAAVVLVFVSVYAAVQFYYQSAYPRRYQETIAAYCSEYQVPESLAYAVVRTESNFRPDATSKIGARGLMQLTEETFDWVKAKLEPQADTQYDAMYEPEKNLQYGIFLLSMLRQEFGSTENVLCAYHAGWGNAKSWISSPEYGNGTDVVQIPFGDTAFYVDKVKSTQKVYQKLYGLPG